MSMSQGLPHAQVPKSQIRPGTADEAPAVPETHGESEGEPDATTAAKNSLAKTLQLSQCFWRVSVCRNARTAPPSFEGLNAKMLFCPRLSGFQALRRLILELLGQYGVFAVYT